MEKTHMKFYVIDSELLNTLIDLMLESIETSSQLDSNSKDNVMYFTWLYDELLELPQIKNARKFAKENKDKILKNKTKDTLTDQEIKMLHYLNQIMKATQKNDKNLTDKQKHARNIIQEESEKIRNDISQHMSLDEIKEFLLDDNSLTPEEKFELYYQEHDRIKEEKRRKKEEKNSMSYDDMMKSLGIKPWNSGKS
tara:strand:- start:42 stop:629 length:588 start_codon:yes stop_codon:yes gene_type:complete